ncbi:MAG: PQQ-binding-like beta-propeller repeat protein [Planctomycetaceae bacterium]
MKLERAPLIFAVLAISVHNADAEDWPQWRGPRGDGTWNAPDVVEKWPENGLRTVWKQPSGGGYAGVIVAEGRVYNADRIKEPKEIERLQCFDVVTGNLFWTHADPVEYGMLDYGNGPRAAPTVVDGKVFTVGAVGQLTCLDATTGAPVWSKHLVSDFHGRMPTWGFAASPFVYGDFVIVTPGAAEGGSIVALDRDTGNIAWKCLSDESTYATPILVRHGNRDQLICWTPSHIRSLDPRSGTVLWSVPYAVNLGVSIATPNFHRDTVVVSGYWDGARGIRLGSTANDAKLAWESRQELCGLMSQPLCRNGYGYLLTKSLGLVCFDIATGKKVWDDGNQLTPRGRNPQATLVWLNNVPDVLRSDREETPDRAIILNSDGELILATLNREGYHEQSRTKIIGETWAHPAYAGRHVFARSDSELICVELPTVEK